MKYKTPYYIHFYLDISILVLILVSYESAYQKRKNNFHGVHWFPARNLTKYDPTSNTFNDSITELMLIRMCFPIMYNYSPIKVQNPKKAPIKCFYLFPILAKCLNSDTRNEIPFLRFWLLDYYRPQLVGSIWFFLQKRLIILTQIMRSLKPSPSSY